MPTEIDRIAATEILSALRQDPDSARVMLSIEEHLASVRVPTVELINSSCPEIHRLLGFGDVSFLSNLPAIAQLSMNLPPEKERIVHRELIEWIRTNVLENPQILSVDQNAKNIMRYRSLLQLWITPEEFRSMLVQSMQHYVKNKGPLGNCSLYLAYYFSDLIHAYPNDEELKSLILLFINAFDRWVALYAFTSPAVVEGVETGRQFSDEEILNADFIISSRRCDVRSTCCFPQAEAGHLATSLSPTRGNNTFVYCKGHLVGSVKHNDQQYCRLTEQNTFLGMRTVQAPDGTYPVIEGGLYIVSDRSTLQTIKSSGDRCDLESLLLMPLRATDNECTTEARMVRKQLESTPS